MSLVSGRVAPGAGNVAGAQVSTGEHTYKDRFGNEWSIHMESTCDHLTRVHFACGEFQLVADKDEQADQSGLGSGELKELFCDAERIVMYGNDKWYVGYRKRMARGGRAHGGIYTRFRSEGGEVRYSKGMLHFRHMPDNSLCEHLAAARPAPSTSAQVNCHERNGGD